jgi:DNA mismatch endonuclease Vsr
MDTLTKERRSWNMSLIKGHDTGPERIVRSILHRMGYRFGLHRKGLPGKPDIVYYRFQLSQIEPAIRRDVSQLVCRRPGKPVACSISEFVMSPSAA